MSLCHDSDAVIEAVAEAVLEAHKWTLLLGKNEGKALRVSFERLLGLGSERVNVSVNKNGYLGPLPLMRVLILSDLTQFWTDGRCRALPGFG